MFLKIIFFDDRVKFDCIFVNEDVGRNKKDKNYKNLCYQLVSSIFSRSHEGFLFFRSLENVQFSVIIRN